MAMGDFAKSKKGHAFLDENVSYMIRGMAVAGYIPKEALAVLDQIPGGLTLDAINAMASRMGQDVAGKSGLGVLMAQSLSVFEMFLPVEKKQELRDLIEELNN